jgi:archaellum component FlaC
MADVGLILAVVAGTLLMVVVGFALGRRSGSGPDDRSGEPRSHRSEKRGDSEDRSKLQETRDELEAQLGHETDPGQRSKLERTRDELETQLDENIDDVEEDLERRLGDG